MNFIETAISDIILIEPEVHGDSRGFFMETWNQEEFEKNIPNVKFVQDNHSKSKFGTLRGLHYQIEHSQGKLVRVVSGSVFDVAVDMRAESPTFGKWVGYILSSENKRMLWVPSGFAHGFYVMTEGTEFVYKCTDYYFPEYERCLLWSDKSVGIKWPAMHEKPILSTKDLAGQSLADAPSYHF